MRIYLTNGNSEFSHDLQYVTSIIHSSHTSCIFLAYSYSSWGDTAIVHPQNFHIFPSEIRKNEIQHLANVISKQLSCNFHSPVNVPVSHPFFASSPNNTDNTKCRSFSTYIQLHMYIVVFIFPLRAINWGMHAAIALDNLCQEHCKKIPLS